MENDIRSLRDKGAIWTSDVDFWIDRMNAFQKVLDRIFREDLTTEELKQVDHFQDIILYYSKELLLSLKSRVFHHSNDLLQIEKEQGEIDTTVHEVHRALQEEMTAMEKTIKNYAEEFEQLQLQVRSASKSFDGLEIKRLLIPTDFSSNAKRATDYALSILGSGAKEIVLLHVFHSPFKSNGEQSVID